MSSTLFRSSSRRAVLGVMALVLVGIVAGARPASAQVSDGVVVIINPRNPTQTLSSADVKKMFLGQTAFWHGVVPVKVVVRPDDSAAAKLFYPSVLAMTPQAFRKHWDKLQLAGRGVAPDIAVSIEDVVKAVTKTPGGVGFALASETWKLQGKDVKIISVR
jgi:ABC-type phosphate transport system substrate-binding protein